MRTGGHSLFEVWGIEIEHMIVDRETLDVRPIADEVLREVAGSGDWVEDVDFGQLGWSNELVSHLIEVKNPAPAASLDGLAATFQSGVRRLNELLAGKNCALLASGMHPWMDPARETRLWPHESGPIYRAYDQLFDCHRHGWANLQSVHLNLPFADEDEFHRLMAAVRLVLPLVPALAASSPIVEGTSTGCLDNRLRYYRTNSESVPAMAGEVIPERVFGFDEYRTAVLEPIWEQLAGIGADPLLLGQEWTNARGAIARFDRMAVEIRVIDAQECPRCDLAVAAAVASVARALVEERWSPMRAQEAWSGAHLVALLDRTIEAGPNALLGDRAYAEMFGAGGATTASALWRSLVERSFTGPAELEEPIEVILRRGTLSERLLDTLGTGFEMEDLRGVYRELAGCLASGTTYSP